MEFLKKFTKNTYLQRNVNGNFDQPIDSFDHLQFSTMKKPKQMIRLILGGVFLILGILGLFLPFLQGLLFLFIGISLLARDIPFFNRILQTLKKRYPKVESAINKFKEKFGALRSKNDNFWQGKKNA